MKTTQQIFANLNTRLKKRLFEPTNREVLRKIIKEIGISLN